MKQAVWLVAALMLLLPLGESLLEGEERTRK